MNQYVVVVQNLVLEKYILEADCSQDAINKLSDSVPCESLTEEISIEVAAAQHG